MPFIAYKDGQSVIPEHVDDGEDVRCRSCLERMRARGPFDDGTARHFYWTGEDRFEPRVVRPRSSRSALSFPGRLELASDRSRLYREPERTAK